MDLSFIEEIKYPLERWEETVKESPDEICLFGDPTHPHRTRRYVDEKSAKVYSYLKKRGIGKEDFVMVCLPRGTRPIIAMLGIWKAGAAFTVVEDNLAPDRIAYIRENCSCKLVIDLDVWAEIKNEEPLRGYEKADDHDAAYAVYTSGTTGNPKGVLHEYGKLKLNYLSYIKEGSRFPFGPDSRFALIAPLNVLAGAEGLVHMIYDSLRLYIVPYYIAKNPIRLREFYLDQKITHAFFPPSFVRTMQGDISPYLQRIYLISEPANGLYIPDVELVNAYSMTEASFAVAQYFLDKSYDAAPVGKPNMEQIKLTLLDEEGKTVPEGEMGEVCFPDPFTRGYIGLPEQTAAAFKDGLYHSGDLARMLPDGNIILLGRMGDMIKINGNRIEPAEIEAVGKELLGVGWCAVRGFEKPKGSFLCLYYKDDISFDEDWLREKMGEKLPYYMIPSFFMKIDEVPLTASGKMARRLLPEPETSFVQEEYAAPRDDLEALLCSAFEKALSVEKIGIRDNFYQIGGDSLSAMQALVAANLDDLSALDILRGGTVEKIAEIYRERLSCNDGLTPEEREEAARKKPHMLEQVQISMFDYHLSAPDTLMWSMWAAFSFGPETDAEKLRDALQKMMDHHPVFCTVFEFGEDFNLQQRYVPEFRKELQIEDMTEEEYQKLAPEIIVPFTKFLNRPMIWVRLIRTEERSYFYIDAHHSMIDGSSLQLFFATLVKAFKGEELPLDTYYTCLENEDHIKESKQYREAKKYYEEKYGDTDWCSVVESDMDEGGNDAVTVSRDLDVPPSELPRIEKQSGISRNGLMTAAYLLSLAKANNKKDVLTVWIFHNRTDAVKEKAGGILFRAVPSGLRLDQLETLADVYKDISKQAVDGIANSIYDWGSIKTFDSTFQLSHFVYETASIMDEKGMESIGGSTVQLGGVSYVAVANTDCAVIETADKIILKAKFKTGTVSEERREQFGDLFREMAETLMRIEDPSKVKVADLL